MQPRRIEVDGKEIVVKMMDDDYIVSDCPQEPMEAAKLRQRNGTLCACMGIVGRPIREVMAETRLRHGNAAVLAWDGQTVVGIMTFFPADELAARHAATFRGDALDWNSVSEWTTGRTLAIATCVLCSLAGVKYRRRGIGTAMVDLTLAWARDRGYARAGVFGVPSGLVTEHWRDTCQPPRPFWERFGFRTVAVHPSERHWSDVRHEREQEMAVAATNPGEAWKLERFAQFIHEVESGGANFEHVDCGYSLVKDLA
jgi:GNAT superfamily N-acetyltransferase